MQVILSKQNKLLAIGVMTIDVPSASDNVR